MVKCFSYSIQYEILSYRNYFEMLVDDVVVFIQLAMNWCASNFGTSVFPNLRKQQYFGSCETNGLGHRELHRSYVVIQPLSRTVVERACHWCALSFGLDRTFTFSDNFTRHSLRFVLQKPFQARKCVIPIHFNEEQVTRRKCACCTFAAVDL